MMKIKHIFYFAIVNVLLYSCGSDSISNVDNFDHEAQALRDHDSIIKFLSMHYYKDDVDSIKTIIPGEIPLNQDSRLDSVIVKEYDINYKYYYFIKEQGVSDKGFPKVTDSILTTYRLSSFTTTTNLRKVQDLQIATWFNSAQIAVRGWLYAFTHFKPGILKKDFNGPVTFENGGKGFFLLPSGLSYRNSGALVNENLLYIIDFYDFVKDTDHDNDGVPSIIEDIDGDGDPRNDDTDGDRVADFLDSDDDGDGKLTKDEDANGDGDPRNDFSDPDNPTLPDYLNRNIR